MNKYLRFILEPAYRFSVLNDRGLFKSWSDEKYIKQQYRAKFKKRIDLQDPKTFNEKLNWLKLNNRKDIYTTLVDKYGVREYISKLIGNEYLIPLVGGPWQKFEDIDFSQLPDSFVLKTTHDSGGVVICKKKADLDLMYVKNKLNRSLKRNYYFNGREWPYKNVPHQIIAEELMIDGTNDFLPVYKFFCFNGEPRIVQTIQNDKQPNETIDYFDTEWNLLDMRQNFPNSENPLSRPGLLDEMLNLARVLSKGHSFIRIDLYCINQKIYFSEFTFYSDCGFAIFHPESWDRILGDWINL